MTDRPANWPEAPLLTAGDDQWHDHSPHWWETETAWFAFNVPDRRICGSIYLQGLGVQETCAGGAWLWDDSPAATLYDVQHRDLPFPNRGGDLRDILAPNGVGITVLEPLMKYRTTYSDPGRFEAVLVHEGTIPPHSHPVGAWPYWNSRHFDQPMHTTGTIVLHGEEIPVDCYTMRDRSWGPRPAGPTPPDKKLAPGTVTFNAKPPRASYPYSVAYMYGTQDEREAFLAITSPWLRDTGDVTDELDPGAGYLVRGGVYAPLVSGHRETELDPARRWVRAVHIEATDALGRDVEVDGELMARHGDHDGSGGASLFRWSWTGGCEGWGEDQSGGPQEWMDLLDGKRF